MKPHPLQYTEILSEMGVYRNMVSPELAMAKYGSDDKCIGCIMDNS